MLPPAFTPTRRVPVNLVAALMMLGPVGNTSVSLEDRLVTVFGILAGLTGVATLIQVGWRTRCTLKKLRLQVCAFTCHP